MNGSTLSSHEEEEKGFVDWYQLTDDDRLNGEFIYRVKMRERRTIPDFSTKIDEWVKRGQHD